jgi:hypothetical protein
MARNDWELYCDPSFEVRKGAHLRVNAIAFIPGMTVEQVEKSERPYAVAISGKTASILVFSVAALNGLTM